MERFQWCQSRIGKKNPEMSARYDVNLEFPFFFSMIHFVKSDSHFEFKHIFTASRFGYAICHILKCHGCNFICPFFLFFSFKHSNFLDIF